MDKIYMKKGAKRKGCFFKEKTTFLGWLKKEKLTINKEERWSPYKFAILQKTTLHICHSTENDIAPLYKFNI